MYSKLVERSALAKKKKEENRLDRKPFRILYPLAVVIGHRCVPVSPSFSFVRGRAIRVELHRRWHSEVARAHANPVDRCVGLMEA